MLAAVAGFGAGLIVAGIWIVWSDSADWAEQRARPPRHFEGHNPAADELQRAVSARRSDLRRSIAPWSLPAGQSAAPNPTSRDETPQETPVFDWKKILVRAAVTFVEAALAVVVAAGTTDLNVETAEAAAVGGLAAVASFLYNLASQFLATQETPA